MKKVSLVFVGVLLFSFNSYGLDFCAKYQGSDLELVSMLAEKLFYTRDKLCSHPRILDIQKEIRSAYYVDVDSYEDLIVLTLHYNEYSCEYHYNRKRKLWSRQSCYNTF